MSTVGLDPGGELNAPAAQAADPTQSIIDDTNQADLGGSGSEAPETPVETAPSDDGSQTVDGGLEAFLAENQMTPDTAREALSNYLQGQSPEGTVSQAAVDARAQELFQENFTGQFRTYLHELAQSPKGYAQVAAVLQRAGGQVQAPQAQRTPDVPEDLDPDLRTYLNEINGQHRAAMEQQQQRFEGRMRELEGQAQAGQQSANALHIQQQQGLEFERFTQSNAQAAAMSDVLADDLSNHIRANPQAFTQPGAITQQAQMLMAKYGRVYESQRAMRAQARPMRGGASGVAQRQAPLPANAPHEDVVKDLIATMDDLGAVR